MAVVLNNGNREMQLFEPFALDDWEHFKYFLKQFEVQAQDLVPSFPTQYIYCSCTVTMSYNLSSEYK